MASIKNGTQMSGWTGWIGFASVLMVISGIMHVIYGFAAIVHSGWYVYTQSGTYFLNIAGWGWAMLLTGIILAYSGFALSRGSLWGRSVGIVFAAIGVVANLAALAAAPVWSILGIVVNALVIYAIAAHGGELTHRQ